MHGAQNHVNFSENYLEGSTFNLNFQTYYFHHFYTQYIINIFTNSL